MRNYHKNKLLIGSRRNGSLQGVRHVSVRFLSVVPFLLLTTLNGCVTPVPEIQPAQIEIPEPEDKPTENQQLISEFKDLDLNAKENERGVTIYLSELNFDFGSIELTFEAQDKIKAIANVANSRLGIERQIAIEGHSDSVGSEKYNLDLSRLRAEAVADELIFSRIDADRITVVGLGEKYPLAPNAHQDGTDNPDGRAQNRRVEILFVNELNDG